MVSDYYDISEARYMSAGRQSIVVKRPVLDVRWLEIILSVLRRLVSRW